MSYKITIIFIVLLSTTLLVANENREQKLKIFVRKHFIPNDVLSEFSRKYKVEIIADFYPTSSEMFDLMKTSRTQEYDVVVSSGDFVSAMINREMLVPLDRNKIQNIKYIMDGIKDKSSFDTEYKYSAPYSVGAMGIAVNRKFLKEYPRDMRVYNIGSIKERRLMMDDYREMFGLALKELGYSSNSTNDSEIDEAKKKIAVWKRKIKMFDSEIYADAFYAGEYLVVQGYPEQIYTKLDPDIENDVDFFLPAKGTYFIDYMVIPKESKNRKMANIFIDYLLSPEVYARTLESAMVPSINIEASKLIKIKPLYELVDLEKLELQKDIGTAFDKEDIEWKDLNREYYRR